MAMVGASGAATLIASMRAGSDRIALGLMVVVLGVAAVWAGGRVVPVLENLYRTTRILKLAGGAILLSLTPLATALVMGVPGAGGYPAVLAMLLGFFALATRDLELRVKAEYERHDEIPVHLLYRSYLAMVSTVFFFFGVLTLWPWLGRLYGEGYFWILLIGVLAPILSLWGKLRQPRKQNSMVALVRFNRVLPYIGFILLLAIVIG